MSETLTGTIERVTFHNPENGFVVLRVKTSSKADLVTVVGTIARVGAGEFFEANGNWKIDANHGEQFQAETLKTTPPNTLQGIEKFLASGLIKGIGRGTAKKIVKVFGEKTLQVIDESPSFLKEIRGITAKRIKQIRESWQQQKAVRDIMIFLQGNGVGTARAVRIYKTYGDKAIELVKANPYRLCDDIWGIGFQSADEVAQRMGIDRQSPHRAQAALRYLLKEVTRDGHVGFPEMEAIERANNLTQIDLDVLRTALDRLLRSQEVIRENHGGDWWLYLRYLHVAECGVAHGLKRLLEGSHPLRGVNVDGVLADVEKRMRLTLAPQQRDALRQACTQKVLVITGGPGVGKTTIVRGIVDLFDEKKIGLGLAAPTGRAAKRLTESTGRGAKTIHRLLEFDKDGPLRNAENRLDLDALIVDEASMIDINLMHSLLQALPKRACLIIVGDVDQLPSVGPGKVLADIIASRTVPVVRLTQIFRQAQESGIIQAAYHINEGEMPQSTPPDRLGDFYFIEVEEPAIIQERVITLIRERIPQRFGLKPLSDIQILTPMNKGELGVRNLNQVLQQILNPKTDDQEVSRFGWNFRKGDKVIQTINNYDKNVFNGDIGRILALDVEEQELTIDFDGEKIPYTFDDLDELALAYALTIHKSQGSEYAAVVIPLHTQHFMLLQRNLLYTAVTRGKKLVVIVGSRKALSMAVARQDTRNRYTALLERLQQPGQ